MNSTKECMQALIDGKTLVNVNGCEAVLDEDGILSEGCHFKNSEIWRIKTDWRDSIPKEGVLCKVSDGGDEYVEIRVVVSYNDVMPRPYWDSYDVAWKNATPLTKAEIQVWLDNAPEES